MYLVRTIVRIDPRDLNRPHFSVAVLGHHDNKESIRNLECCRDFVEEDVRGPGISPLLLSLRDRAAVYQPQCGRGQVQADPSILWQKIFSGVDVEGIVWNICYSVIFDA